MALNVGSSRKRSSLRVLAHFVPGDRVIDFLAPEADWLDIRYGAEDDDETFYRELPEAEVIWHVLRPISREDLEKATDVRLVHKMGAVSPRLWSDGQPVPSRVARSSSISRRSAASISSTVPVSWPMSSTVS